MIEKSATPREEGAEAPDGFGEERDRIASLIQHIQSAPYRRLKSVVSKVEAAGRPGWSDRYAWHRGHQKRE